MRLINTSTLLIEEFIGQNIPQYAILSHTWEKDEVSFAAMKDASCRNLKGFRKIEMTCKLAAEQGLSHAWVDTCSIDKSSSAELAEAINSMYRWYERSTICFAYLYDLPSAASLAKNLRNCRWFTRGWTLQELIAPKEMIFYDQDWNARGSKVELIDYIHDITHIAPSVLLGQRDLSSVPVAQKMSWAANRKTRRREDMAYCLLGLFDINMALLYGEQGKAFRRLQEEIIKTTPDLSIFGWRWPIPRGHNSKLNDCVFSGVLADSPRYFAGCTDYERVGFHRPIEFSVSGNGIKMQTQLLLQVLGTNRRPRYILPLHCYTTITYLGVYLRKCGSNQFIRVNPWNLANARDRTFATAPPDFYLSTRLPQFRHTIRDPIYDMSHMIGLTRSHGLQLDNFPLHTDILDVWPAERFDSEDSLFFVSGDLKWDYCGVRLGFKVPSALNDDQPPSYHDVMFVAVGYNCCKRNEIRPTIFDYKANASGVKEIKSFISKFDPHADIVLGLLLHHGIPNQHYVTFPISAKEREAKITFDLSIVQDAQICQYAFWRVTFRYEEYAIGEDPDARLGSWDLGLKAKL